jgi:hypothetical protein
MRCSRRPPDPYVSAWNGAPITCGAPLAGLWGTHAIQSEWRALCLKGCWDAKTITHERGSRRPRSLHQPSPTFKTQIPHPSSSVRTEPLTWPDGRGLAGSAEGPSAMFGGWGLESSGDRPSPSRPKPAPVSVPEEGQEDSFRFQDDAGHKPIPPCIRREYTTHPAQKRRPEDAKETHSGFGRRTPPLAAPLTCLRGVGRMCIHRLGE